MTEADQRQHHFVPVSYLKPWCDNHKRLRVQRLVEGKVANTFSTRPENLFKRAGLYDMSGIFNTPSSLLETGVFAEVMEPSFARIRKETIDQNVPLNPQQCSWIAECCLSLYYRNPLFGTLAKKRYGELGQTHPALLHHGSLTLALTMAGGIEIVKRSLLHLIEAGGDERYVTSDVPCWMWHRKGEGWCPMSDLGALEAMVTAKATATRWICALSPRYALEICSLDSESQVFDHSIVDDARVRSTNEVLKANARQFIVLPSAQVGK